MMNTHERFCRFSKMIISTSSHTRLCFVEVARYVDSYNSIPTKGALKVAIDEKSNINEEQYKQINDLVDSLSYDDKTDLDWLVDKTEKFCQGQKPSIMLFRGVHTSVRW